MKVAKESTTINDDPVYAEAARRQNELSCKHNAIVEEVQKEEALIAANRDARKVSAAELVGSAMALEPGVHADDEQRQSRLVVLRGQVEQVKAAMHVQAAAVHAAQRAAGYRVFAQDDGGYVAAAERLIDALDAVIAINAELQGHYTALCARGCSDIQQVQYPNPLSAENVLTDRRNVATQVAALKQTAKDHSA